MAVRHEDLPGRGPSPARHRRIKEWAKKTGIKLPDGRPLPDYPGQVPAWVEDKYVQDTGDTEGSLRTYPLVQEAS